MKVELGDIETAYIARGDGPPVVLIHGLAEGKESWLEVQDKLEGLRTYASDLRGHGETTLGNGKGTLEQLGSDLIAFLEEISGPAQCVGYSLGGTIVLWATAQRPDLVKAAVVTGTSTVVGRQAARFFEERIRTINSDFLAFANVLRKDTKLQLINPGVDIDAVTAKRLEAVGDASLKVALRPRGNKSKSRESNQGSLGRSNSRRGWYLDALAARAAHAAARAGRGCRLRELL